MHDAQGQLDLAVLLTALTALMTIPARRTIPRTTSAQRHAAGNPGHRDPRDHADLRARAERPPPKAPPVNPAQARPASQDGINGHDATNREAGQNSTANQNS